MAYKVQKPCKVCGKMYTPCAYCENEKTAFHWRTVACSKECGYEYLRQVMEARNPNTEIEEIKVENETVVINEEVTTVESVEEVTKKKTSKKKIIETVNNEESEQIE
jgi:hypothetical protein